MLHTRLITLLCTSLLLTGCEQARVTLADMLDPPDAAEITARVEKLAGEGKPGEAIRTGEDFLKSNTDPDGTLRLTLARIHTETGNPAGALRHLEQASSQRLDGGRTAAARPAPSAQAPGISATAGDAAATIGPHGIEVRAGGVTASIKE